MQVRAPTVLIAATVSAGLTYAQDSTAHFSLPSGVAITIVESRVEGSTVPNCRVTGKSLQFSDNSPTTFVKSISGEYKGMTFQLDGSCMSNAWNGRPLEIPGAIRYFGGHCKLRTEGLYCTLRGVFADGAESFVAEWNVVAGQSHRTVLSGSQDIINLFITNIDALEHQ